MGQLSSMNASTWGAGRGLIAASPRTLFPRKTGGRFAARPQACAMGLPYAARYAGGAEARVDLGHAAQGERANGV